jgi:NAD(P)-dependent dehydrogenase (short-subunit alcohol dehydrogenase family)
VTQENTPAASIAALFDLRGNVAFVTGAASGIGAAVARMLAEAGSRVLLADRNVDGARQVAEEIGGDTAGRAVALDVTDPAAIDSAFKLARETFGPVTLLVNNAGASIRKSSFDLSVEEWRTVLDVNLQSVFLCSRGAAGGMLERGSGAIVNIASIMGLSGGLYPNAAYHASKGGVVNLTRAMAVEWAPTIRVNAVAPTWVRTPFIAPLLKDDAAMERIHNVTPMRRIAEPHEVAAAVLFLCSPAAAMTTGHTLAVDGGFLAV